MFCIVSSFFFLLPFLLIDQPGSATGLVLWRGFLVPVFFCFFGTATLMSTPLFVPCFATLSPVVLLVVVSLGSFGGLVGWAVGNRANIVVIFNLFTEERRRRSGGE